MLILSLVGAAAIIILFVIATPMEPLTPDEQAAIARQIPSVGLSTSDPGTAAVARPERSTATQSASGFAPPLRKTFADLGLPTKPLEVDAERLQAELLDLADCLSSENPDDSRALHIAAQTYAELKRTDRAREVWEQCLALSPEAPGPYAGLAKLMIESGEEEAAIQTLQTALDAQYVSAEVWEQIAAARENLGELEEAAQTLQSGLEAYPQSPELLAMQGRVQSQLGNYEAAERSLRAAMEIAGPTQPILFQLSIALTRQQKQGQAAAVQEQLQELQAERDQNAARPSEAGDLEFQASYSDALAQIAVAQFLAASGLAESNEDAAEAERLARRSLELDPQSLKGLMALSTIYRRRGELDSAFALQRQLATLQPNNVLNFTNLASVALQMGDAASAEEALVRGVQMDPTGVLAQASLARLYLVMGRIPQAVQLSTQVAQRQESVEAYVLLANALEANGQLAEAAEAVNKARSINPQHPLLQQ